MDKDDLKIEDVEMKTEQQIAEVEGKEEQDRKKEESSDVDGKEEQDRKKEESSDADVLSQKREDKDDLKIEDVEMKTEQQIAEVEGKEEQDRKKEESSDIDESSDVDVLSQKREEMSTSDVEESEWITGFCGLKRSNFFCEVDVDYILDSFNLQGLERTVHFAEHFHDAVTRILYDEQPYRCSDEEYYSNKLTEYVYAQIHSRFIMTKRGIKKMVDKWKRGDFGHCPRIFCDKQNVLPIGLTGKEPPKEYVCLYCPKCQDVFEPKRSHHFLIDGIFFENFPHMLFMVHPEYRPQPPATQYVPKLYGFKINKLALDLQYEAASKFKAKSKEKKRKKSS